MILIRKTRNVQASWKSLRTSNFIRSRSIKSQTQEELAKSLNVNRSTISKRLKAIGMIQKQGNWVPYELKPKDVERRKMTCELLLQKHRRKSFLHRIVKRVIKNGYATIIRSKKSWCRLGESSTSTAKPNSWRQAHAVYLMGSAGYSVLWAAPIQRNHHWRTLPTTINAIEPSIEAKMARLHEKIRQSDFSARQRSATCCETGQGNVSA